MVKLTPLGSLKGVSRFKMLNFFIINVFQRHVDILLPVCIFSG